MKNNLFDLSGQVAFCCGGSSGLGLQFAKAMANAGADIALVARRTDRLDENAREIEAEYGVKVYPHYMDLQDSKSITDCVSDVVKHFGKIDILINAAGINRRYWLEDFPLDMWDEVIATNLNGTVYCSQLVGQYMLRQGYGRIVNLASMNSFVAGPKMAAYVASKGGIAQVTKAFANEWGGRGIRVNAIAPGYQTLPLQQDPKRYQEILDRIAVGRWGKPDDLVGPVLMLCSEAGSYCNGLVMPIDGGYLAR